MSIYARGGDKIKITEARIIPVWSVQTPGRISRLYKKPPAVHRKQGKFVETTIYPMAVWHYKGVYVDNGKPVCDGRWVDASMLVADGGWTEIESVLVGLNPEDNRMFHSWNKGNMKNKQIEEVFVPIKEKEVA